MAGLTRETRLQIMLTDEELDAIDTWRFQKRMPSRAAAIRNLIRVGLEQINSGVADAANKSEDFGVVAGRRVNGLQDKKS